MIPTPEPSDIAAHFRRAPNAEESSFPLASREHAGGKGAGLLKLPPPWYPPTIVIAPALDLQTDRTITGTQLAAIPNIVEELAMLAALSPTGELMLRSSAEGESISDRGAYLTEAIAPTAEALAAGMMNIWAHATHTERRYPVGFLLQPRLEVRAGGHLSNEHRVSRASTTWVLADNHGSSQWQVQKSDPADEEPLVARNTARRDQRLRTVARALSTNLSRMHLEWVWDGDRLWIVQADPVPPTHGRAPGDNFEPEPGARVLAKDLRIWAPLLEPVSSEDQAWPKLRAIAEFRAAGLGGPEFWTVSGAQLTADNRAALLQDLELLCHGHLLIRADRRGEKLAPNLTRSDALTKADDALAYLNKVHLAHTSEGSESADLRFIAHRFIRARAAAWVCAWPDRADVRVDSLWGLADGLAHSPHDTAWVNIDTGNMHRTVNAKTQYLETAENGTDWHYETTPTEWIWKTSITRDQLLTVAQASRGIAAGRGGPVVVMWFIGVLDGFDAECLAWVTSPYEDWETLERAKYAEHRRFVVTCDADLGAFEPDDRPTVFHLEPTHDLLRDNGFLKRVADSANRHGCSVELLGSPLAHDYYLLRKEGVAVLCPETRPVPPREFNKLVRDGIVPRVEAQGERAVAYTATQAEYRQLLRRKLVEESIEVLEAEGEGAVLEELADVEEVLAALRQSLGIDRETVIEVQDEKREKRGGFERRSVLLSTGGSMEPEQYVLFDVTELQRHGPAPQVEVTDGKLELSLVPPPRDQRAPFSVVIGEYEVTGRYGSHAVTIEISRHSYAYDVSEDEFLELD